MKLSAAFVLLLIINLVSVVCDNMLKDLEREHNLLLTRKQLPLEQDAFGVESRREILEPYDEKKEAEWRGKDTEYNISNKIQLSLCFINYALCSAMNAYVGVDAQY
jgi:hypothetical protein